MSRNTGSRQTLEFRAASKAAAERDAKRHGLDVLHVDEEPDDQSTDEADEEHIVVPEASLGRRVFVIVLIVIAALIAAYVVFPQVRTMLEP